jgi:carbon monoxide dehydrogenase subunit G
MRLESKIGKIESTDERIYNFLTDFNNFKEFIPADKLQNWQADETTCRFSISPLGETGVQIIEKEPYKLIKIAGIDDSQFDFKLWVQLKQKEENDTRIKLTLEADLNPMFQMMAKKPLQEFLDKLVDQLSKYEF